MTAKVLNNEIVQYSEWRSQLSDTIQHLSTFLKDNNVSDLRTHHQLESTLGSLADDNLSVAFVAEFSRGKSEMINTLFFGDYKQRILPSASGRTTMCPTELLYDPHQSYSIRLLPIESRKVDTPLYELKNQPNQWTEIEFDANDAQSIKQALAGMTNNKLVSRAYAEDLNFNLSENQDSEYGLPVNEYDEVEIPCWRHAIINLPHPLLKQGLVILDTPGLNAIGAEPELTINQLSTAHTVVFILTQDTGVTATDLALWQNHLGGKTKGESINKDQAPTNITQQRKLVALNKIDTLWDGIRSESEIQSEIEQQIYQTSKTLGIDSNSIFPVSAQKGLLGKLSNDNEMLARSGIAELERAIAERLIPQKKAIVIDKVEDSLHGIIETASTILNNRLKDADSHIAELKQISSKNTDVISHIMLKVQSEKSSLEKDMQRYQALQSVYNKETKKLTRILHKDRLEKLIATTKHNMTRCASSLTLQKTISKYFDKLHDYLDQAMIQANEIANLSENITRDFQRDHGIDDFQIRRLRLEKFKHEVSKLEHKYRHLKNTKTLFFREQITITNRFYESVCGASRKIFDLAFTAANDWNNNLMVPMETYVREHHTQLRRRLESVKRIHKASDTVETRLEELAIMQTQLHDQHTQFKTFRNNLMALLKIENNNKDDLEVVNNILYWKHNTSG